MKNKNALLVLCALAPVAAFAADASLLAPPAGFEWVSGVLAFLQTLPTVGPVIVIAAKVLGATASFLTLASVFVQGVLAIPEIAARYAGAPEAAAKVKNFSDKVLGYLKYFSMFNVQK